MFGHFGVNKASAGGHQLNAAWAKIAFIAFMVFVLHEAHQQLRHGFKAAVRMVGKTGDIIRPLVRFKLVQQ